MSNYRGWRIELTGDGLVDVRTSVGTLYRTVSMEEAATAIAAWNRRAEPSGWVRVEDRLPDEGLWCLILYDERVHPDGWSHPDDWWVSVACLVDGRWVTSTGEPRDEGIDTPTHWRPLPAPPEDSP